MSERVYTSQAQKPVLTCSMCGRKLGVGFYFTCHICGRNYCYAHIPVKCSHAPLGGAGQTVTTGIRR